MLDCFYQFFPQNVNNKIICKKLVAHLEGCHGMPDLAFCRADIKCEIGAPGGIGPAKLSLQRVNGIASETVAPVETPVKI